MKHVKHKNWDFYTWNFCRFCLKCLTIWDLIVQRKVWIGEHWQFTLVPKAVIRAQHTSKSSSGSKTSYPETFVQARDSSSSALKPWVGLGFKQMLPENPNLGSCQSVSTTQFPWVFLYPINPSWFWSATSSLTSRGFP